MQGLETISDILKNELCTYLGELTYQYENEFDWETKDLIGVKINAVNVLLGIDDREKTWFEKLK